MNKIFLCFSLAAVLLLSAAPDGLAVNILTNYGFEEGDFPPTGWSDWSGSGSEEPTDGVAGFPAPQEMTYSGSKCIGKILYGAGDRWGGFSQTVDIVPGNSFEASGWVLNKKNDVPLRDGAKVYIEVKFLGQGEKELKVAKSNSITQPANWTKLSVRGLVPSDAKKAVFSIVLTGTKKSTGKILFDEASLNIGR